MVTVSAMKKSCGVLLFLLFVLFPGCKSNEYTPKNDSLAQPLTRNSTIQKGDSLEDLGLYADAFKIYLKLLIR